jgi:hypothetical protein
MKRAVTVLAIALCAMALPSLAAQQANSPPPAAGTSVAPASSPSTALPGPRLQPELRPFAPNISDSSASGSGSMSGGSHTFVISTLALVLIVVIVVLLVAK